MDPAWKKRLLDRLDQLIHVGENIDPLQKQNDRQVTKWQSDCEHFLQLLGPHGQPWAYDLRRLLRTYVGYSGVIDSAVGMLDSIHDALSADLLIDLSDLVRGEVFTDLLEQAEHLLDNGYFLAAAVIAGAVFEDHLREMCARRSVAPTSPRPTLQNFIAALYATGHLDKFAMKQAEAIAAARNGAAHAETTFKEKDAEAMVPDVRRFIANHPA